MARPHSDPKTEEARLRRLELRKQATTFASVADDFIERHVKGQRKAVDTEREIRKELIASKLRRVIANQARDSNWREAASAAHAD